MEGAAMAPIACVVISDFVEAFVSFRRLETSQPRELHSPTVNRSVREERRFAYTFRDSTKLFVLTRISLLFIRFSFSIPRLQQMFQQQPHLNIFRCPRMKSFGGGRQHGQRGKWGRRSVLRAAAESRFSPHFAADWQRICETHVLRVTDGRGQGGRLENGRGAACSKVFSTRTIYILMTGILLFYLG